MNKLEKNNKALYYEIMNKNNKHTYFRSKPGHVLVTTNKKIPIERIEAVLLLKFDRFYEQTQILPIESDDQISLWGRTYQIIRKPGRFKYEIKDDSFLLTAMETADIKTLKKRVYLAEMKRITPNIEVEIKPVLDYYNIKEAPIHYSYFISKFGSFHKRKYFIKLNTFLATLDSIHLKYVLYHEYAHTVHFNHSTKFYDLLMKLMPNYREIQKQIKSIAIPR